MRILLVEDDPMIADAVKSALADEARAVDHVSSLRSLSSVSLTISLFFST